MKIITDLTQSLQFTPPIALSIGMHDGIHLGHQAIIKHLYKQTQKGGTRVILTFSNHPSHLFNPSHPTALIISLPHRLHLLETFGIHAVLLLPFTQLFAEQSYRTFLTSLHTLLPFTSLTFGEGAVLGKDRQGTKERLIPLGKELGFQVEYLKKASHHKEVVTSDSIRQLIAVGALKKVKKLLGRPYSIQTPFDAKKEVRAENTSLFTWTTSYKNLCLLPSGVYGIDIEGEEKTPAIGFLKGQRLSSGETELSLTLFFEKIPSSHPRLNLTFTTYMHNTLTPELLTSPSSLQKLFSQPTLS